MSNRPTPLSLTRTGTAFEEVSLTPRTPHSRTGRAEEAYEHSPPSSEYSHYDDDLNGHSSADPLLSSRSKARAAPGVFSSATLVFWCIVAAALLCMVGISFRWPNSLRDFIGIVPTFSAESTPSAAPATHTHTPINSSLLISYENYTTFPLTSTQYLDECYKMIGGHMKMDKYWADHGGMGVKDVEHVDDDAVCSSTITYMLDGARGLFSDLALIAQAAALARERNRTFLIDDTYWNRGNWTDHFTSVRETQPGPEPGCKPPPPQEYVSCPRMARHWVITSKTAKFHFGHGFINAYEDGYKHNNDRSRPIYDQAVASLSATISPSSTNAHLILLARSELPPRYSSAHVRRGDQKPKASEFRGSYIPLSQFADVLSDSDTPAVYIASDSPSALSDLAEMMDKPVFSLPRSKFADVRALASHGDYFQSKFNALGDAERVRATRGMVVDFAIMTGAWTQAGAQEVVCTLGSAVCKLAAVALGWENAFGGMDDMGLINRKKMRWVDMDEKGTVVPQWSAYNLF